tara:strand:- start:7650 stop:8426 length:777 start_codon:yes stop_codon:yes gene_type:complete
MANNLINNYFDKVYVVTTKRLKNRHKYIKEHLDKFNIEFELIYGPDKDDINLKDFNIINTFFNLNKNNSTNYTNRVKIDIVCIISHYMSWQDMISKKYRNCLIMEDDCCLVPNFLSSFKNFTENIKNIEWDILQLGWQPFNYTSVKDIKINNYVKKQWSFIGGAHCYAITNRTAQLLVKNLIILNKDKDKINNDSELYRNGAIYKGIDGYIGDISNILTKNNWNINIQSYCPIENLAADCSHGNQFTDVKFSVYAMDE